jgi:hypothetical protein
MTSPTGLEKPTPSPGRVRLIWDFFGPRAERTARHHRIHLDEFTQREQVAGAKSGAEAGDCGHWMAWLELDASDKDRVRAALRPRRELGV